jgi:hypothetical protein
MTQTYCYLDESGVHEDAQVCVIAGYFGEIGQWRKFRELWKKVLRKFDVPCEEFHAKDVVKRRDSARLQLALAETIARYKIYPVAQGILVQDFYKFSLAERRFLTGAILTPEGRLQDSGSANKPYFAPFQPLIKRVLSYSPPNGRTHFFFGLNRPFSKYATGLYSTLSGWPHHPYHGQFGGISFPLAKDTPGLQAADFLVHLTYLHMLDRMTAKNWYVSPPQVVRILQTNIRDREDLCFQDEHCIRETLRTIPIEQRGELLKDDLAVSR